MTATAIIQARMGSERFPGKVLADLHGQSVLQHVIRQASLAEHVNRVVVATCYASGGGAIAGRCDDWGVPCWIDDNETDVLARMTMASRVCSNNELIVRVCGDNPMLWPDGIDALVMLAGRKRADYAGYKVRKDVPAITEPNGYVAEVVTREALERANREAPPGDPRREHVTAVIYEHPGRFKCRWLTLPEWISEAPKAAVDTEEDLERVTALLEGMT